MQKKKREEFIRKNEGLYVPDLDYFLQFSDPEHAYNDPKVSKAAADNIRNLWETKREHIFTTINRIRKAGKYKPKIKDIVPDLIHQKIDMLLIESPFRKNRRRRLRFFLNQLYQWEHYIHNLPRELVKLYDEIYKYFSHFIENGLTPLPVVLMGRWAGGYIPGRIPIDKIHGEKAVLSYSFIKQYYQIDSINRFYVLKGGLDDEALEKLEYHFLENLAYRNKSGSKYKYFLDYLIKTGTLTKCENYSTNCRSNYYKINWE
jgi:hypothetical protein